MYMEKFTQHAQLLHLQFLLFSILATIHPPIPARPLPNTDHFITFFINDVLESTIPPSSPVTENTGQLPFPEPTDLFNLKGGTTTTNNPNGHVHGSPDRAGASVGWLSFLKSVQAPESGNVTVIDEELMGRLKGKVKEVYVTSSEDENSRMVAMRAVCRGGKSKDSLRFFGEHQPGLSESHIAIVGGTGRYHGANGFVVVKAAAGQDVGGGRRKKRKFLFTVYIQ